MNALQVARMSYLNDFRKNVLEKHPKSTDPVLLMLRLLFLPDQPGFLAACNAILNAGTELFELVYSAHAFSDDKYRWQNKLQLIEKQIAKAHNEFIASIKFGKFEFDHILVQEDEVHKNVGDTYGFGTQYYVYGVSQRTGEEHEAEVCAKEVMANIQKIIESNLSPLVCLLCVDTRMDFKALILQQIKYINHICDSNKLYQYLKCFKSTVDRINSILHTNKLAPVNGTDFLMKMQGLTPTKRSEQASVVDDHDENTVEVEADDRVNHAPKKTKQIREY